MKPSPGSQSRFSLPSSRVGFYTKHLDLPTAPAVLSASVSSFLWYSVAQQGNNACGSRPKATQPAHGRTRPTPGIHVSTLQGETQNLGDILVSIGLTLLS